MRTFGRLVIVFDRDETNVMRTSDGVALDAEWLKDILQGMQEEVGGSADYSEVLLRVEK